ncbi:MAG: amidohydrolase [Bacteroidetes bacterium]|nr:amidohydrolase [Bacteroidota bacterium]
MQNLKIALIQSDILWEDIQGNLNHFDSLLPQIDEPVDLIALPEVFNTGFPVDPDRFAENMDGSTMKWMHKKASQLNCSIAGSLLLKNQNAYFNTFISMKPDGTFDQYSKRHVFHLGDEADTIRPGNERLIFNLNNWKIRPLICYDLRFPVWSKNTYTDDKFEYDLLIYVANWPASRSYPWKQLLIARAIENQAYVIGLNRIGIDGSGNKYSGDSLLIDPKGEILLSLNPKIEEIAIVELSLTTLTDLRRKFNVGPDWDKFTFD